jgi:hypothetical protein
MSATGVAFLLMAALPSSVAPEISEVSVAQLAEHVNALDGRIVRVRGWVHCGDWGCSLRTRLASPAASVNQVNIGDGMKAELVDAADHQVILEGRVTAACRREICTDHAPDLLPTRLVRIFGAPRATAKDR